MVAPADSNSVGLSTDRKLSKCKCFIKRSDLCGYKYSMTSSFTFYPLSILLCDRQLNSYVLSSRAKSWVSLRTCGPNEWLHKGRLLPSKSDDKAKQHRYTCASCLICRIFNKVTKYTGGKKNIHLIWWRDSNWNVKITFTLPPNFHTTTARWGKNTFFFLNKTKC